MRDFFVNLFRDDVPGPVIEVFNIWHLIFAAFIICVIVLFALLFNSKDDKTKKKVLDLFSFAILFLYFSDFMIHPLLLDTDTMIVDKLPFHLCTSMGLLLALTRIFPEQTKSWHNVPAILGLVGSFFYLVSPSGVAGDKFFCYRTLQTLLYHGVFFAYGILAMIYGDVKPNIKKIWKEAAFIGGQIAIALCANAIYSVPQSRSDSHDYNWYFVDGGSLGTSFTDIQMPFVTFGAVLTMAAAIYGIYYLAVFIIRKAKKN